MKEEEGMEEREETGDNKQVQGLESKKRIEKGYY